VLLITHTGLSNTLAYSICEAIDARQSVIPVDDDVPLDMKKLFGSAEAAPLGIPLHSGARKYFAEHGYL